MTDITRGEVTDITRWRGVQPAGVLVGEAGERAGPLGMVLGRAGPAARRLLAPVPSDVL